MGSYLVYVIYVYVWYCVHRARERKRFLHVPIVLILWREQEYKRKREMLEQLRNQIKKEKIVEAKICSICLEEFSGEWS